MLFIVMLACDNAAELQQSARSAQMEADQRIAAAKADAARESTEAQASADAKVAEATADFGTLREEYRHRTTIALVELDQRIAKLEAKAEAAKEPERAERRAALRSILALREAFELDYATLDIVTGATWDATTRRLDAQWATLVASVDAA